MIKISAKKLLGVFAVLVVILCSGHAIQTIYTRSVYVIIPFAALVLFLELIEQKLYLADRTKTAALLFIVMVGSTMLACLGVGARHYLLQICYIIAAYGIAKRYSVRTIANCHNNIIMVTTIIAIVGYILLQNTSVLEALPLVKNVNDVEYRFSILYSYIPIISNRNCGMFWEPGLFATQLIISMVFEIMLREKPSFWRLAIFAAGIVTANSSAGFALLFFCIILLFLKKANLSKNPLATFGGVIALVIGVAVVLNFDTLLAQTALGENEFFQKLSTDSVVESSRINAIGYNLEMFLAAPFFGNGFVRAFANVRYVADTSTSTYLLNVFGILGVLFTVYWGYGIFRIPKVNLLAKILIFVVAMVILNKEPHHRNLLSWCLMFALVRGDFSQPEAEKKKEKQPKLKIKWR